MRFFIVLLAGLLVLSSCGQNVENIDKNSSEMSDEMKEIKEQLSLLNQFVAQLARAGLSLTDFIQAMMASMQTGSSEIDDDQIDMDDFFGTPTTAPTPGGEQ